MEVLKATAVTAMLMTQAAELPAPFPRPGTTKILENDAVAVWNVSWLQQKYPLHTHRYDLVGISYAQLIEMILDSAQERRIAKFREEEPNRNGA